MGLGSTGKSAGRHAWHQSSTVNTLCTLTTAPKSPGCHGEFPRPILAPMASLDRRHWIQGPSLFLSACDQARWTEGRQDPQQLGMREELSQEALTSPPLLPPGAQQLAFYGLRSQPAQVHILALPPVSWVTLASHLPSLPVFLSIYLTGFL